VNVVKLSTINYKMLQSARITCFFSRFFSFACTFRHRKIGKSRLDIVDKRDCPKLRLINSELLICWLDLLQRRDSWRRLWWTILAKSRRKDKLKKNFCRANLPFNRRLRLDEIIRNCNTDIAISIISLSKWYKSWGNFEGFF